MKQIFVILSAALLLLTGCDVEEMSSLKDISKPYAAEYRCSRLQLGGEDLLGGFERVALALSYGGDFRLYYRGKDGSEGEYRGGYLVGEEAHTITLSVPSEGEEKTFVFPYEKGKVIMRIPADGKLLYAEFSAAD